MKFNTFDSTFDSNSLHSYLILSGLRLRIAILFLTRSIYFVFLSCLQRGHGVAVQVYIYFATTTSM